MADSSAKLYGVIDVGSNSIRLSVYRKSAGSYPLQKVFDEKRAVGLASYVDKGCLSEEGIRAAAKTVKRQISYASLLGCSNLCVFATAALRNCSNSKEAVAALSQMTGARVDLISSTREAELGFAGIQPVASLQSGFVVDIGGGSAELSFVRKGSIVETTSLPLGSLSLWTEHVRGLLPTYEELEACRAHVRAALSSLTSDALTFGHGSGGSSNGVKPAGMLYGIGGTTRMAMKMWAGYATLRQSDNQGIDDPEYLSRNQLEELIAFALDHPGEFGHLLARTEPTRIHTCVPGLVIMSELLGWAGIEYVYRTKHGIREGYVLSCML